MSNIANTPKPPYYAVIFTSLRTDSDDGYEKTAARMVELASQQPGFLGVESVREGIGVTVSYWSDLESIKHWKMHAETREVQKAGVKKWYSAFKVRISKVERDYGT